MSEMVCIPLSILLVSELILAETAFECMKAAYDAGINFFDTAEVYSAGQSEIVLGEAIKKFGWKQNDLVISTKVCHAFFFLSQFPAQRADPLTDLLGQS